MTEPVLRREVTRPNSRVVPLLVGAYVAAVVVALATVAVVSAAREVDARLDLAADYYVAPDDTLSGIARRLRVRGGVAAIVADNQLADPDRLRPGQRLRVVVPAHVAAGLRRPFANPIAPATTCVVEPLAAGDIPRALPLDDGVPGAKVRAGRLDVDGDGYPELIVARYTGTSNGIALRYHQVAILDGRRPNRFVRFTSTDWGVAAVTSQRFDGLFLRVGSGCMVAPQSFERFRDPVLGEGHYFVQRLFHYRAGRLSLPRVVDARAMRLHPAAKLERAPGATPRWPSDYTSRSQRR